MSDIDNTQPRLPGETWEMYQRHIRGEIDEVYKMAGYIQSYVVTFNQHYNDELTKEDRAELAMGYVDDCLQHEVEPASLAFLGLQAWHNLYGRR